MIEAMNQRRGVNSAHDAPGATSLDQMMRSSAKDDYRIQPYDPPRALPISEKEERIEKARKFSRKILDGTIRDKEEILRLLKEMRDQNGELMFKTFPELIFALSQVKADMGDEGNSDLKQSLLEASSGLLFQKQTCDRIKDKTLNPDEDVWGNTSMWEEWEKG